MTAAFLAPQPLSRSGEAGLRTPRGEEKNACGVIVCTDDPDPGRCDGAAGPWPGALGAKSLVFEALLHVCAGATHVEPTRCAQRSAARPPAPTPLPRLDGVPHLVAHLHLMAELKRLQADLGVRISVRLNLQDDRGNFADDPSTIARPPIQDDISQLWKARFRSVLVLRHGMPLSM